MSVLAILLPDCASDQTRAAVDSIKVGLTLVQQTVRRQLEDKDANKRAEAERKLLDELGGQLHALGTGYSQMVNHQRRVLDEMERLGGEIAEAMRGAMGEMQFQDVVLCSAASRFIHGR